MKLAGILKSFTKAQKQLDNFIKTNGEEIAQQQRELSDKQADQQRALTVSKNIAALLGDSE